MYITNMSHFLDDEGKTPRNAPKEARELAGFLLLVIDSYTRKYSGDKQEIRCFTKNCRGVINVGRSILYDEIHWNCPECNVCGKISEWRGTAGENSGTPPIESAENVKNAFTWIHKLTEELEFPISVIPVGLIAPEESKSENWVITRITDYVEIYGLIVEIEDGKGIYQFPIAELSIKDEQSMNYKLVEEFLDFWFTMNDQ
ncbi:MAG TPA: hypothetical protein P5531_01130 [Bacteroidales bacterium]|nr:hypothetical protein [Bacteroidales bacterium]HSA42259.1 hypothetical protein [Bacteroidales bacterium]